MRRWSVRGAHALMRIRVAIILAAVACISLLAAASAMA